MTKILRFTMLSNVGCGVKRHVFCVRLVDFPRVSCMQGLSDRDASTFDVLAFLTFAATKKMLAKGEQNYMVVDWVQSVLQATQLAAFLRKIIVSRLRNMTPMLEFSAFLHFGKVIQQIDPTLLQISTEEIITRNAVRVVIRDTLFWQFHSQSRTYKYYCNFIPVIDGKRQEFARGRL